MENQNAIVGALGRSNQKVYGALVAQMYRDTFDKNIVEVSYIRANNSTLDRPTNIVTLRHEEQQEQDLLRLHGHRRELPLRLPVPPRHEEKYRSLPLPRILVKEAVHASDPLGMGRVRHLRTVPAPNTRGREMFIMCL
uniref:Uncharacterized protein n=1 Tax=Pyramimonas obovata TaxID=1411642 RepID=A0A7S0MPH5_9CHLO|mmetsp:Transcript_10378/g.21626  ORF Transcript_10378/g.21626 Transcript_10378/m.21626 type:complete len:138 (+) Transcript_10378:2371-2784(+)